MTTNYLILALLSIPTLCLIVAWMQINRENQWCKCPGCRSYHRGNVKLAFLPPDDGAVRDELCIQCSESKAFFEERERDIKKRAMKNI